ncbi:Multicopper oxidase, type 1 [Penicillium occitanis (nom. inval.)]|nr:Multicopper oxidase, type 1 [Penicillium occitanis (nom. inval.)]PCG91504.1 hypothetical protein PENOC_097010 [Penicillium occitanis (nom. inval.)]
MKTPGSSQVYEFRALQYGTSWYHSHFSLQYSNGLVGPLVIHGPSSANWDVELETWLITDWYHADAFKLYYYEIETPRAAPPDSMLLNGKGIYNCTPTNDTRCTGHDGLYEVNFDQGTRYKIAIAHTGTLRTQTFWIDGHNFTVIENDFVSIEPYVTDVITVGIGMLFYSTAKCFIDQETLLGQRYEIIVEANADFKNGTNFWIHSQYCNGPTLMDSRVGIIRYDKRNISDPYTPPPQYQDYGCADPDPNSLVPIVKRQVGNRVNGMDPTDYLKIGLEAWPNASDPNSRIHKWVLKDVPMLVDWEDPSLKKLALDKNSTFPLETQPITLDFDTGEWVYFVITNNYTVDGVDPARTLPQSVHPIHLHGHDFVILAQGEGTFTSDIVPNLDNPARRDVANCPLNGYLWIAFQVNNPGAWLMHCHIAWHASDGLSIQYIEQPSKIKGLLENADVLGEFSKTCDEWTDWYTNVNEKTGTLQEDSGI